MEEKIGELLKIEIDLYMSEEPGIENDHYRRKLKTKNGKLKLNVPGDRKAVYHSALVNNDPIKVDDLTVSMYARFKSKGKEHVHVPLPQSHVHDEYEKEGNNSTN